MDRLTENKIILVKRKTRFEELIARYNTAEQAKFYIEHLGGDFSDYVEEDRLYRKVLISARNQLELLGRLQIVDRDYVPNFIFGDNDVVVVIGQDGLVANTLKYLSRQPLIAVNPDPSRWEGVLLPFKVKDLKLVVPDVFNSKSQVKEVSMAKASLNDGQMIYAVNDLFIGQKTHVSSRYHIQLGDQHEYQSSSGVIVSTGLGSTGWLKSILTGAVNIAKQVSNGREQLEQQKKVDWNIDYLYFSVREPFPSRVSKADMVFGRITKKCPLKISSQMPENGVIFSDGIESDYLQFNSGIEAAITVAEKKGHLVV
ncbi:sugar kinase [Clostridium luticellarii]|jgi:NAD kinase|uniref:sugar kinase n=1 Tax=Clostridium luticellarii TaxID=1691940 RepID=UPI00235600A0|nr:sugar kinase [Clostridium luticellarii]MCI1945678.1 sugar kinase [Clostridium luticellarii]MCI1967434.1 sugar kinase [Clostridium luticellarii]MCI1996312.1 sugar kinase [Clostridium luticellarii]MCI2039783.1 sugar kinase [Clostridium luticellarii]